MFFGCDVGKFYDRDSGIMDLELFEYEVRLERNPAHTIWHARILRLIVMVIFTPDCV